LSVANFVGTQESSFVNHIHLTTKLIHIFPGLDRVVLEPNVYHIMSEEEEKERSQHVITPQIITKQHEWCCEDANTVYWGVGDSQMRYFSSLLSSSTTPAGPVATTRKVPPAAIVSSLSIDQVPVVTLVDSASFSSLRNLMGSMNQFYPSKPVMVYHYGLLPKQLSELNIMQNTIILELFPRMKGGFYEQQKWLVVHDVVSKYGSCIFVHVALSFENTPFENIVNVLNSKGEFFAKHNEQYVIGMTKSSPTFKKSQLLLHVF